MGLVGESGSGKSVTALSVEGLLPPNAEVIEGRIILDGKNLLLEGRGDIRSARLTEMAMVFQAPSPTSIPSLRSGRR